MFSITFSSSLVLLLLLFVLQPATTQTDDYSQIDTNTCYFPVEFHGTFKIQTQASEYGQPVQYNEITIVDDAIPPWGKCYKRKGEQVILRDQEQACFRCVHISLKTPNVIQIFSDSLNRCYINEEAARIKCPSERDVQRKPHNQLILFRDHLPGGDRSVENVFSPLNGQFKMNYSRHSKQNWMSCDQESSEASNCPNGNVLAAKFHKCKSARPAASSFEIHYLTLGSWDNPHSNKSDRFLALVDLNETPLDRPRYRCGMYREDPITGIVYMSLSADSNCNLIDALTGYETFVLTPFETPARPALVENSDCHFPQWSHGKWALANIDSKVFKFKDQENQLRTLNSKCVQSYPIDTPDSQPSVRMLIHSQTQCLQSMYQCVWIASRSANIVEFKFGRSTSQKPDFHLCDDKNFERSTWITLGRKQSIQPTACPISGDYTGVMPEENSFCAKISSDCNNPDIMFYTVSLCQNKSHIFEQREYKCFGRWEEDGILYTYTQRRDMPGYQCFTGKLMNNGDEVYITEAGQNCVRGDDPLTIGMKITKQTSCPRSITNSNQIPVLKWNSLSGERPSASNRKSILSSTTNGGLSTQSLSSNANRVFNSLNSYSNANDKSNSGQLINLQSNRIASVVATSPSSARNLNNSPLSTSTLLNGRDQSKDFYQADNMLQPLNPRIPARGRPSQLDLSDDNSSLTCRLSSILIVLSILMSIRFFLN